MAEMNTKIQALRTKIQAVSAKIECVLQAIKTVGDAEGDLQDSNAVEIPGISLTREMAQTPERIEATRMLLRTQYTDLVNHLLTLYKIYNFKFDPPESDTELEGMEQYVKWLLDECEEPSVLDEGASAGAGKGSEKGGLGGWLKAKARLCADNLSGLLDVDMAIGLTAVYGLAKATEYFTGSDIGGKTGRVGE